MNTKKFKQLITIVAFIAVTASFSSCNRGVGCPSNFSVDTTAVQTTVKVVKTLSTAILRK